MPEPTQDLNEQLKRSALYIMYGFMVVAIVWIIYLIRPVFAVLWTIAKPFAVAWIIAYLFNPIVNFVQQRLRLSRIVGLIVTYVVMLVFLALIFLLIIPGVVIQLISIIQQFRQDFIPNRIIPFFERLHQQYLTDGWAWVQAELERRQITLEQLAQKIVPQLAPAGSAGLDLLAAMGAGLMGSIAGLFGFVGFLTFVFIINFYMILEFSNLGRQFRILIPGRYRERALDVLAKVDRALGGFLRGQFTVMIIVGSLTTVLMFILGLKKYAILIGFLAGVGNVIPYLGPVLGATPAVVYIMLTGDISPLSAKLVRIALVVASFMGIQALEGFVLQPKVVGRSAELHPLIVLLALIVGGQFGLVGMIVALPVAAVARVLVKEFFWDRRVDEYEHWAQKRP
ncbi:MAG: AI-2E family transporter [Candidatus Sumerlaeia bacterium]